MKNYQKKLLVGYTRDQMFNMISDIEAYENFVPFCNKLEIISRNDKKIKANIFIGFKPIVEKYLSTVELSAPEYIRTVGKSNSEIVDHLETLWIFSNGPINVKNSCITEFSISFCFKTFLFSISGSNF
ncbi:coenzyme Q-binding protein COQ10 homolog B, mitochondrial-like [Chrysoperla carnea]|uniref:coenzyme Q-binding protein COQ10 homolog B, mitochondrial-like n=1 Tax=Chrysoperla carnea TaxID=189513 RepID=UPI001D092A32|nr:coenzyme Q-binding protein COQ10 homolog B, mitochondrial-like [Chrysoperla carnea]